MLSLVDLVSLVGFVGLVDLVGLVGLVGHGRHLLLFSFVFCLSNLSTLSLFLAKLSKL